MINKIKFKTNERAGLLWNMSKKNYADIVNNNFFVLLFYKRTN